MARNVEDAALLLSVMAGPDPRVPISLSESGAGFLGPLASDVKGLRFAWSSDLGGNPIDPTVTSVLEQALPVFENLGGVIDIATPDLQDAEEIFSTFRAWMFVAKFREDYEQRGELMKDTLRWNIEQGLKLTLADVTAATIKHAALVERIAGFFDDHDILLCPAAQVPPFSLEEEWVHSINGVELATYLDWMAVCWAITVTGCPAISVPAGFTDSGLPIGIQIVGARGCDRHVLDVAHAFEQATKHGQRRPALS